MALSVCVCLSRSLRRSASSVRNCLLSAGEMKHPLNLINKHLPNATDRRTDGRIGEDEQQRKTYKEKEKREEEKEEEKKAGTGSDGGGTCGEGIRRTAGNREVRSPRTRSSTSKE